MSDVTKVPPMPRLGNNIADRAAALGRSIVGAAPIAGPFLAELLTSVIPNQRLDRVEAFLDVLAQELERLGASAKIAQNSSIPLVEEGISQAARAFTEKRREFLAKCVAHGVNAEEQAKLVELRILQILGELGDDDLLLLDAHSGKDWWVRVSELQKLEVWTTEDDALIRRGLERASKRKLELLGLLTLGGVEERVDHSTGKAKGLNNISVLGEQLLHRVGLGVT